jgi:putative FmdB family regulatory protein
MDLPTYDYKCTKCGYAFSAEQSIRAKPLTRCRKCRGKLEKLPPQRVSLIFKGSGFYATDYKNSSGAAKGCAKHRGHAESAESGGGKETDKTNK